MSSIQTVKTIQKLTPIIVRVKNMMNTPMYVTAYDGTDIGEPTVPMELGGPDRFWDVAKFDAGPNRWDYLYLGHDRNGQTLTIYFKEDENAVLTTTIGTFKGRREQPGPLDAKYATAQAMFFDGVGNFIMQFNLLSYYADDANLGGRPPAR